MTALLWLLVALPAAVGGLLLVVGRRADRIAAPLGVLTAVVSLGLSAAAAAGRPRVAAPFLAAAPFGLAVDGLSAVLVVTVAAVTLLVLLFSVGDIRYAQVRFFGLMLLFAAAVLVTSTATTLPALLFAWEVMGATSYALIAFHWREDRRVAAGATAFLTTRAADLGLYVAAGAAYAGTGSLTLTDLARLHGGWLHVAAAGVLLAAAGKAAQLPFSFWLSRAMEGPSPVSALLHSAAMVAMGGYLLLRLGPLLAASGWADDIAAWLGASTALLMGVVAVAQRDLKQLLAASTSAQLGFVVLAAGVGGVAGGMMHLVAHAATKALLFLAAGAWLSALGTKNLMALRGAARRYGLVGATFAAGSLSLAGLPPLALWATKDEVLAPALHRSPALYVVGLAAAALSAVYAGKALVLLLRPLPADAEAGYDTEQPGTRRVDVLQKLPLVVLAAGALLLGLQTLPPVAVAYTRLVGGPAAPSPDPLELGLSAAVAIAALALAAARPVRPLRLPALAERWLDLELAAHAVVVRPTLRLARALARFDDRVLDGTVTGVATTSRVAAAGLRRVDERGVDGLVRDVTDGALRLGRLARRPQTGQLHQYYAQAVTGLVVAAAILLLVR